MNRRELLLLGCSTVALSTCGGGTSLVTSLPAWATTLSQIVSGIGAIISGLGTNASVPASVVSKISQYVNDAASIVSTLTSANASTQGQSTLTRVEADINSIVDVAAPIFAAVPILGQVLGAAVIALPLVETAIGVAQSFLSPAAQATATLAPTLPVAGAGTPFTARMTPTQALSFLQLVGGTNPATGQHI